MLMRRPLLKRVRMDNCHAINHMNVGKECNTCQIRYKKYRQEIALSLQSQDKRVENLS